MKEKYFYEVMFDDTSIDVSKEVGLVWSIANSLRGAYTSDKYKDVIIPMVIIRRFECALEATKDAVVAKHKQNPNLPKMQLWQSTSRIRTSRLRFFVRFPNILFIIIVNTTSNAFWMTATTLHLISSLTLKTFPPTSS